MTTINHNFNSSGLISITALGSFSSTSQSRRRLVPPHLCHRIGGTSIYKSEGYFIGRVLGMIRDDKEKQESDDEDLGG